jgi:flagellar protein FlaG
MTNEISPVGVSMKPVVNVPTGISVAPKVAPEPVAKSFDKEAAMRLASKNAEISQNAIKMMERVDAVVDQLNKLSLNSGRGLSFSRDEQLGVNTIVVTNTTTGEVVRTIPTDVAIKIAHGIEDFKGVLAKLKGLLYDHEA